MIRHSLDGAFYLREAGDPEGPPLLWIHGLGESGLGFEELFEAPELQSWQLLAPDLPGYGKSLPPERPLSLEEHAATLARWLADRRLDSVTLVGHSMGGVIGQQLCAIEPDRIAGLVDVEGNITIEDCTFSARATAWSLDEFLRRGFRTLCDELYDEAASDPALRRYFASMRICDPGTLHRNARELVDLSTAETLAADLGELTVPVHYVWGDPRGTGQRSRKALQAAEIACTPIPESGHWPFLDQPETFLARLTTLLEEWH